MYKRGLKRFFDIFAALIGIILCLPVWIVIPILIKRDDGGAVFYKAPRIGKNSQKIHMLKFRSMKEENEDIRNADGSTYNAPDDPRVTRIGKFLRETSIDELPQLFNVLKGDMSIVGPRASTWDALESYQPDELDKMNVRPGITGHTQAYFRNSVNLREKRLNDAWYANHVTLWLDIKILFKTVATVLKRENLYTEASASDSREKQDIK